jgi:hypothetical protein
MNPKTIPYIASASVIAIAGIFLWTHNPGRIDQNTSAPVVSTSYTLGSAHDPMPTMNRYRSVLVATHPDAWEARRQLEMRQRAISSLAAIQGGAIRLGATHYIRVRDTAEFEIRQEITVSLPSNTNWGQIRQDLWRLSRNSP